MEISVSMKPVEKRDAANRHVWFEEQGWKTGPCSCQHPRPSPTLHDPPINPVRSSARRIFVARLALGCSLTLASVAWSQLHVTSDVQAALGRISADSLRKNVSFLASDLLEGRYTPSPGLEIAAEYIAAQFRRAGLEPAGDDGYFQTAAMVGVTPNLDGFEFLFESRKRSIRVPKENVERQGSGPVALTRASVVKVSGESVSAMAKRAPDQACGKVVLVTPGHPKPFPWGTLAQLRPALVVLVGDGLATGGQASVHLRYPSDAEPPWLLVQDAELLKAIDPVKPGPVEASITVRLAAPTERATRLRNVVALLPGSDAKLKDTYVLLTAHYDHVGGKGDQIRNGANDNASGTASIMEVAAAIAGLREKPKRSIVFAAFFGEERGKMGARHYGQHPLFPIERTVANINLEQVGRTDDSEGPQIARASLTGFDYSDVGQTFRRAGQQVGVKIFRHKKYSDSYFRLSDSPVFADLGIPAHTLWVTYDFPDYHRPGDTWDKLDYGNLEKITRAVALGVLTIANTPEPPRWNEANRKAQRYLQAWTQRHSRQ